MANQEAATVGSAATPRATAVQERSVFQAYWALRLGFIAAPILAGLDKFFYLLTDWSQYASPIVEQVTGGNVGAFMAVVGVIEIAAGIGVAFKPRVFAYVIAAWLVLIILNLLLIPGFFDVALRDLGLALGAFALGRLSEVFEE